MTELQTKTGDILSVDSQGAKMTLSLRGVAILGSFVRGDGKQGITHPCTPIFGPDRKQLYGLKQHGNMRNETCTVSEETETIRVSHTVSDEGYPAGVQVEQIMKLTDGVFHFTMTHINTGVTQAAVNAGEHCYFDAPSGFAGTQVNRVAITDLIKNNNDGIAIDLKETNTIQIPGKPTYILEQQGLTKAVVWVGKNPETKAIDQTYVCIEPVEADPFGSFFGSAESMIDPHQRRSFTFTLRIQ